MATPPITHNDQNMTDALALGGSGTRTPECGSYYQLYVQRSSPNANANANANPPRPTPAPPNSAGPVEVRDWNAEFQDIIDALNEPNQPDDQILANYRKLSRLAQDFAYATLPQHKDNYNPPNTR